MIFELMLVVLSGFLGGPLMLMVFFWLYQNLGD